MSELSVRRERVEDALFRAGTWLVLLFLLIPIAVVVATSFNTTERIAFPPEGFSLEWYWQFFTSPEWLRAVTNSLVIGIATSVCATVLGVTGSLAIQRAESDWPALVSPIVLAPLLVPPVVLGLTLLIFLDSIGVQNNYLSVVIAHTLWATPLVFFIMQSVFARFDWQLRDAGMDLGARPHETFGHVILPNVRDGVVVAALVAFIISLQEFVMALFLTNYGSRTVPVLAWESLQQSLSPMVSVVSTFLVLASALAVLFAAALMNMEWLADQL